MKKIISSLFILSALALILVSCKKEENEIILEGGTNPIFTASTAGACTVKRQCSRPGHNTYVDQPQLHV